MTVRATVRLSALAALSSLVVLGALGAPAAFAADDDESANPPGGVSGPTVVHIPYQGSIEVKPAAGWTFSDCGALLAATPLVTACLPDTFTAAAPEYDPGAAPTRVTIALSSATLSVSVDYLLALEPPAKPSFDDLDYGYPFVSGSRAMIPLSDLAIACGRCSVEAAEIRVGTVEPADAGSASVTGTHLVFASRAGFTGAVEVALRAVDDIGTRSSASSVTLHFVAPGRSPLVGLHVVVDVTQQADGAVVYETDAADLVLEPASSGGDVTVIGCGPAVRGSVVCLPDGRIEYRGAVASGVDQSAEAAQSAVLDQFSVHLQREDGEQATASVTVRPTESGTSVHLAPAIGEKSAPLLVPTLSPPPSQEQTATGVTSPFVALLDRVGG